MQETNDLIKGKIDEDSSLQAAGRTIFYLASVMYLSVFLAVGSWCAVNLLSTLSSQGRILFTVTLMVGLMAVLLLLRLFPRPLAISLMLTSSGVVFLGWVLYFMFKNYGLI